MGVTSFLLLSCLGLAITAQAQDCSKPPAEPHMMLTDEYILLETFPDGSQVTFTCDVGYVSSGLSGTITCTAGSWSSVKMRCQRKSCGSFEEVENGEIDYSGGNEFGDKIVITCKPGYRLVGNGEIHCGDKGWMGRKPDCEVVTCDPPAGVAHASFSPVKEIYEYRDAVQYSCQKDFTLSGSEIISCSENGTFMPPPPTCVMVQCADPDIKNGAWIGGSRPPYGYRASVTFKCDTGYKMDGERTVVCEINSQWSPGIPTCKPVTCDRPPTVKDGTFSPNKASYTHNEAVEYSCQKDFTLRGSKSIRCSDDGKFTPDPPTCTRVPTTTKATPTPTTPTPTPTPPTTTTTIPTAKKPTVTDKKDPPHNHADNTGKIVGGIIGGIVIICLGLAVYYFTTHRKKKGTQGADSSIEPAKGEERVPLSTPN